MAVASETGVVQNVQAAWVAGVPRPQIENFLRYGYIAIDGYMPFHAAAREADDAGGPEWVALGGKRGPGKSHAILAQVGLDDCQRVPGLKWLFLRKVMRSAAESLEDLAIRVFQYIPHSLTAGTVNFGNDSRILLGGYNNERDIEKYLGLEYDGIVLEEATQISEGKKDRIRGSLRTSKDGWRPRIYLNANPDGIGLAWFKRMFVEPGRAGQKGRTRFFDVSHIHNPFVNKEYGEWLDTLTGALGKAWREGDWDAFAGMAFPSWDYDRHVIKPFEIPDSWVRWRSLDWGYAAPFSCHWYARHPDTRRIYVYQELYQAQLTDRQQARMIRDLTPHDISITFADPSMWTRKNREGEVFSTADEYAAEGVILSKADNDRRSGKRKVDNVLADLPDGLPGVQIFENCTHLIEQLSSLSLKQGTEDVDTDQEDHAYDDFRYGLTNERRTDQAPPAGNNPLNRLFSDQRNRR